MAKSFSMANFELAMAQNNAKIKEWVTTQMGNIKIFTIEWVEELPTENISTSTIYMVKDDTSTAENNIYNEFVYNETSGWEILGQFDSGSIDIENYYSKQEIDEFLAALATENYSDEEVTEMIERIWSE